MWDLLEFAVEESLSLNASFVEVRGERQTLTTIRFVNNVLKSVESTSLIGIGVTVIVGKSRGHGFTSVLTKEGLRDAIRKAIDSAKGLTKAAELSAEPAEYKPKEYHGFVPSRNKDPETTEFDEKFEILRRGIDEIRGLEGIASIAAIYAELHGERYFINSEGLKRFWRPLRHGILFQVVARKDGNIGSGRELFASSFGLEVYEKEKPEEIAMKAYKGAIESAQAKTIQPGKYPLIADPDFAGVLAHESFGHLTESDYVATKASILYGRLHEQLGSEYATIIESGDPVNYGFFIPYDDEGVATEKIILLNKGVLENYLHSRSTAKLMNMQPTGNARAINFMFPAIVRMRNTYFDSGDMTKDELFELVKHGVYVEGSTGGQTEDTGNFTFGANRAYYIENSEIAYPLKGVVVRAHILDFLRNIIGASKEVIVGTSPLGGCGKAGQSPLPVGGGGPYLAIKEALIGGGV
ncbi:MAG: TldD/PmbA family protein [Candidatus Korarchaeota archaeon]|nr:TldD/PmbA family protein [Thermoproteota archaeon]